MWSKIPDKMLASTPLAKVWVEMDEFLDCKQNLFEQYLMDEITLESYPDPEAVYDERLLLIKVPVPQSWHRRRKNKRT